MRFGGCFTAIAIAAFATLLTQACGGDDGSTPIGPESDASTTPDGTSPDGAGTDGGTATCTGDQQVSCNGACTDTRSDPKNCGTCGRACDAGLVCSLGECVLEAIGAGGQGSGIPIDGGIVIGNGGTSGTDPNGNGSDVGRRRVGANDGCACELMRRPSSSLLGPLLGVLALCLLERRRRARKN